MVEFYGYIGAESLDLTAAQRAVIVDGLRLLGTKNESEYPNQRNHFRVRLDGLAVIFHATFDPDTVTQQAVKGYLVDAFGVAASSITYATVQTTFGSKASAVVTYKHLTVPKFRLVVFGGPAATNEESAVEVRAYLRANAAAWEGTA